MVNTTNSVTPTDISDRMWTQIRAALQLWVQVAKNSDTHPCQLSGIAEIFGATTPILTAEIELFLERCPKSLAITTLGAASEHHRVSLRRLRVLMSNVTPIYLLGSRDLYRAEKVKEYAEKLKNEIK